MMFNKKGFEVELQKIIANIPFRTRVKDFTKDWSYLKEKESEEVMYLVRVDGPEFDYDILIHSSIDPKTGKSKKDASGVRIGYYEAMNYGIRYTEMKRIKRTLRLAKHLREGFFDVVKFINTEYKKINGLEFDIIRKPAKNMREYGTYVARSYTPRLFLEPITRGVFDINSRDGVSQYKRIADSLNDENFIVYVMYSTKIKRLVVDTVRKKVVKALDLEGNDVSDKVVHIVTKRDGLIVPLDPSHYSKPPQDWYVRVD